MKRSLTKDQLEITADSFSTKWWKYFLAETKNLSKPKVFKKILDDEISVLEAKANRVLRYVQPNPPAKDLAFWIDGQAVSPHQMTTLLKPPLESESLEAWVNRHYPENEVGIILNTCQNFDQDLKDYILAKFQPLLKAQGMPSHGIDITFFAGNYNHTPLGFHLDQVGHKVIHLHLGPATKEMYLIPKETFEKDLSHITKGQRNFHDVDKIINHATIYTIEAGDLFFMPYGYYHVGRNSGFSIAVTVWYQNLQIEGLAEYIMLLLAKKIFPSESFNIVPNDLSGADDSDFLYSWLGEMSSKSYSNTKTSVLIRSCILEYKYLLHSNNFYVPLGELRKRQGTGFKLNESVTGDNSYKIYLQTNNGRVDVFVQGQKLSLPPNKGLRKVIAEINKGTKIKIKNLIEPLLSEWSKEASLYFIDELYMRNAIHRC